MKKAIKLTLAVVFVMGATSLFAQQKFGRINTQEIIVGMPETKEMQTNMEAYAKDLQDNLESMTVEYNQKLQEFQKNFNTLSESVRQLKENDLNALIQRRNEFEQAAQQDFQKRTRCWPRLSRRPRTRSTKWLPQAAIWPYSTLRRVRSPISTRLPSPTSPPQ